MSKLHNSDKKKKSKGGTRGRKKDKLAGLKHSRHPKIRHEFLDFADYLDQLTIEEKEWFAKFIDEYMGATLAPVDSPKEWRKDFHKSKKQRKICQDRVNALNRDLFPSLRLRGLIEALESLPNLETDINPENQEDVLIEMIDLKDRLNAGDTVARLRRLQKLPPKPQE